MDQFGHLNPHTGNNRVYINRNFNRLGRQNICNTSNTNIMYFNPNFSHKSNTQNCIMQQIDLTVRPKIHVNPNFMRQKTQDTCIVTNSHINTTAPTTTSSYNQISCIHPTQTSVDRKNIQMANVTKSRYCLVRQNEKNVKSSLVNSVPIKSMQQTVKLSKYKLVSLNSVKKGLALDKKSAAKSILSGQIKLNQSILKPKYNISSKSALNIQSNRFKLVKRESVLKSAETIQGVVRRVSITHNKNIIKTSIRQTKKIVKRTMKKNNIPCPLFKKYGKCLRMLQGSCDYLHDKKHVSICRKFLKGICHDKQCLLSHDLTDKKMPTCYFYLQGNCTKESCPYLHVKLNEKTKICPNFLKGYCDNGDKCLHRHVNVSFKNNTKLTKTKKGTAITNKNFERTKIPRTNTREDESPDKVASKNRSDKEINKDQRYFKDATEGTSEEQYNLIKPTRCKLGTLPSFIQL